MVCVPVFCHIANRSQCVAFVHGARAEAPLPEKPRPALAGIDMARIAAMGFADRVREAFRAGGFQDEVDMVGHEAPGPASHVVCCAGGRHQIPIERIVPVFEESLLAPVAPLRHMMRKSGQNDPGLASHTGKLAQRG